MMKLVNPTECPGVCTNVIEPSLNKSNDLFWGPICVALKWNGLKDVPCHKAVLYLSECF